MQLLERLKRFIQATPHTSPFFDISAGPYVCKPFINPMQPKLIGSCNELYKILKNDDVVQLASLIESSKNEIGTNPTMDLYAIYDQHPLINTPAWKTELRYDIDVKHAEYLQTNIAGTDWFSAAVYLNSTKCIEWAIYNQLSPPKKNFQILHCQCHLPKKQC